MKPSFQLHTCVPRTMALAMLVLVLPTMALLGETPPPPTVPPPSAGPNDARKPDAPLTGAMEVHFSDGSILKVVLKDERIELETPYGKLLIPVVDIQRIEFGQRSPKTSASASTRPSTIWSCQPAATARQPWPSFSP